MDQREDQSQKRIFFNKKQFMKRTLPFVISVSLFSIFFWYSSRFSIHPQSFNVYFSTCLFSMFTHTLERKYVFLICNGILAFVTKSSLMSSSASISDSDFVQLHASHLSETCKAPESSLDMVVVPLGSFETPEKVPLIMTETDEEQVEWKEEYYEEVSEAEEQEEGTVYTQNEACTAEEMEVKLKGVIDEEGGTESDVKVAQDDDYDDDDELAAETTMTTNEELANTDELNRKFEEFIRKMKEEMRIEAQRQLIAV